MTSYDIEWMHFTLISSIKTNAIFFYLNTRMKCKRIEKNHEYGRMHTYLCNKILKYLKTSWSRCLWVKMHFFFFVRIHSFQPWVCPLPIFWCFCHTIFAGVNVCIFFSTSALRELSFCRLLLFAAWMWCFFLFFACFCSVDVEF